MARKGRGKGRNKAKPGAASGGDSAPGRRSVARNRRATYDYEILERTEAGLVLSGSEIKSLREGRASIQEAYVRPRDGEMWLVGAHISQYEAANQNNHDPKRDRKLLLHRREIAHLQEAFEQKALTIVPMHLYIARGLAKLEIGVGRGRRRYDKRAAMAARDAARRMRAAVRR